MCTYLCEERAGDCKPPKVKTTNRAAPCHEFLMCAVPETEETILHCSEVLPMEKFEGEKKMEHLRKALC